MTDNFFTVIGLLRKPLLWLPPHSRTKVEVLEPSL